MSKPFTGLLEKMPAQRRAGIEKKKKQLKIEMALRELRLAMEITQTQLANTLQVNQAAVSKFERQSDISVSTLRRILAAMGARLQLVAQFEDGEVIINQFDAPGHRPAVVPGQVA
jgi:transcriptional regulator with XRE-family HTH domain